MKVGDGRREDAPRESQQLAAGSIIEISREELQRRIATERRMASPINGLTEHDIERIAAAVAHVMLERDATIAELRAEIARLNEANVRLSAANADLHRDVTWRAAEIARMTLAANAWHEG